MPTRSELVFKYDDKSFAVSATCSLCGEKMPLPHPNLTLSADRVMWFAKHFIEHKKQRHTSGAGTNNLEFKAVHKPGRAA